MGLNAPSWRMSNNAASSGGGGWARLSGSSHQGHSCYPDCPSTQEPRVRGESRSIAGSQTWGERVASSECVWAKFRKFQHFYPPVTDLGDREEKKTVISPFFTVRHVGALDIILFYIHRNAPLEWFLLRNNPIPVLVERLLRVHLHCKNPPRRPPPLPPTHTHAQ